MKKKTLYKSGADPENIEPGGANSIEYHPQPGGGEC